MAGKKILVTGATGFIGGTVLAQLLDSSHEGIRQSTISVVVRREDQTARLAKLGTTPILVQGLDDVDALAEAARTHDIVLHLAIGFHTASAKALIAGLGSRDDKGKDVRYIQLSGTSNLAILSVSEPNLATRTFSDLDEDIYDYEKARNAIDPYPQRTTDLAVVDTGSALGVKTSIVVAPQVYGQGGGLFSTQSQQLPQLIQAAIDAGSSGYIGDGQAQLGNVHVQDLAKLFHLLVASVLDGVDLPTGKKGFYFANTASATWREAAEIIGKAGFELGVLKSAAARSISLEEAAKTLANNNVRLAEHIFATSSSTTPDRSIALGWKPSRGKADWEASIKETFATIVEDPSYTDYLRKRWAEFQRSAQK